MSKTSNRIRTFYRMDNVPTITFHRSFSQKHPNSPAVTSDWIILYTYIIRTISRHVFGVPFCVPHLRIFWTLGPGAFANKLFPAKIASKLCCWIADAEFSPASWSPFSNSGFLRVRGGVVSPRWLRVDFKIQSDWDKLILINPHVNPFWSWDSCQFSREVCFCWGVISLVGVGMNHSPWSPIICPAIHLDALSCFEICHLQISILTTRAYRHTDIHGLESSMDQLIQSPLLTII